jgi:molybdate transport system substrate-binding protein
VLIAPQGGKAPPRAWPTGAAGVARITIGNPASVPVGRYTKAALEQARLWARSSQADPRHLGAPVPGLRGARRSRRRFRLRHRCRHVKDKVTVVATVPTETPVTYPIAVIAAGPQAALGRKFADYVQSPAGQAMLAKYGFGRP